MAGSINKVILVGRLGQDVLTPQAERCTRIVGHDGADPRQGFPGVLQPAVEDGEQEVDLGREVMEEGAGGDSSGGADLRGTGPLVAVACHE